MDVLILVDLDNVLGALGSTEESCNHLEGRLVTSGPSAPGRAVVVLAFNTASVARYGLDVPRVTSWGDRIARSLVGASPRCVELVLTLTMPQSVDMALLRLLKEAPAEASAGRFERAMLISGDRGLAQAMGRKLGRTPREERRLDLPAYHCDRVWTREAPLPPLDAAPKAAPAHHASPIGSAAEASWAASQPLSLGTSLGAVAQRIERLPGELTAIGLSRVARGVARLMGGCGGTFMLGPLRAEDGLVLHLAHQALPPPVPDIPRPRDMGVVDLPLWRVTARTRLPAALTRFPLGAEGIRIGESTGSPCLCWAKLDDVALLGRAPMGPLAARTRVAFRSETGKVCVHLFPSPALWWCLREGSQLRARGHVVLHGVELAIPSLGAVASDHLEGVGCVLSGGELVLGPASSPRGESLVPTAIPAGAIGRATTASGRSIAVFAPFRSLAPTTPVLCVPVQVIDPALAPPPGKARWEELVRAPLAVPLDQVSDFVDMARHGALDD
jgi:hypothetical protein